MKSISRIAIILSSLLPLVASAAPATLPVRTPKYAPKTKRTLHSDEQIALARRNVAKYPAARAIADATIKSADKWVDWKDDDLTFLLTPPDVPRAFAVSASGCPVCGKKIKEKGGDYAWIIDPKQPYKVKCPIDGTVFPSNDYQSYYRSGFTEKKNWDGKYVDDGWGWADPKTGEKFWFVAYYNHWIWHKYLVPGLGDLADAYLLTGDKKYAHKAAVMLHRIAEVYPGMDHAKQSRYGQMMAARGADYPGKVVNAIWETGLAQHVCDAYDAVWETIDGDEELQRETHQTGAQIRCVIEANFLENAIDAYFSGKIRGNFGMHQGCLVHLALVRQTGENDKWFDGLMNASSSDHAMLGLNFALYDLVYRDGVPSETSPGYNFLWVNKIAAYGDQLQHAGRDVFGIPKTKRLFDAVLDQVNVGKFTPDLGDAGGVYGYLEGKDANTFQTAYRYYKDPRYAAWLARLGATGDNTFKTFESLFSSPIDAPAEVKLPPAKSRLQDGAGLAILNNPSDTVSLSLEYGQHHGHGHYDRLGFELFANDQPIMPDLGYPDAMNDFVPGIYTWSKNTISHNTVVVDGQRQQGVGPGEVKFFADSPLARVIDVDATDTYPQCSVYRRAIIQVDVDESRSYFVDIFTVAGGQQHDYSLHGPPGEFEMIGGNWSEPAKGTLAGEDVPLGRIYDDPKMAAKDYQGGFSQYAGSGFQHLFNVRTQQEGGWVAQFKHEKDLHAMLRIRVLDQPAQQVMLCDAHVSPGRYPQVLKYLIARRKGDDLKSRFVSVIEPFKDKPFITSLKRLKTDHDDDIVKLEIQRGKEIDTITYNPTHWILPTPFGAWKPDVVVTRVPTGRNNFFALSTTDPDRSITGEVKEALPMTGIVRVELPTAVRSSASDTLVGRVIHFSNARHRTAHTIATAKIEANNLVLTLDDDILVGVAKLDKVEVQQLHTSTALPLYPSYRGTTLTDELFHASLLVDHVDHDGNIKLLKKLPDDHSIKAGDRVWLMDVGVGDRAEIPFIMSN